MTDAKDSPGKDPPAAPATPSARSCLYKLIDRIGDMQTSIALQAGALKSHADTVARLFEADNLRHDDTDRQLAALDHRLEDLHKSMAAAVRRFNVLIIMGLAGLVSSLGYALFYFATKGWPWAVP